MNDTSTSPGPPSLVRAGVRIALGLILPAAVMAFFVPRDSAEFVILVLTIGLGLVFGLALIAIARLIAHLPEKTEPAAGASRGR